MKFTISKLQDFEVVTLRADMGVRYWEDGEVNGESDDDGKLIPLRSGDGWKLDIELSTGKIANWPEGTVAKVHYKVADAGIYSLIDSAGQVVAKCDGYVPSMLCPKDNGYGDYVILEIDGAGQIDGWEADLSYFQDDE